jgi:hypothetical protein
MRTQSHQLDDIPLSVNPYQQEITLDMAFEAAFVVANERVWEILFGYRLLINQQVQKNFQLREQLGLMPVPLQVFFTLGGRL